MASKEERQTINVTLPAPTLKLLEEAARGSGSSVDERAAQMIQVSMPMLHPPETDDQWLEEIKEVQQGFSLLQRQFSHELQQKQRDKDEEANISATSSLETDTLGEGEQVISVTLSRYRIERLQEISHQRGTSIPEEAARLIRHAIDERHTSMTDEEQKQQAKETLQEMDEMWKDIANSFRQDK